MSEKILGISGPKQSGKTTAVNFLHGYELHRNGVIERFEITEDGNLVVNTEYTNADGVIEKGFGELDIFRKDHQFIDYASNNIWPYVKSYGFADPLKTICMNLFGLTYEQCYGSEEEKNSNTKISKPNGTLVFTARELMQYVGTNMFRILKPDVWTSYCLEQVLEEKSGLAIIGDCRFPNEVEAIRKAGGKVIRFLRCPHPDGHSSEVALDNYNEFDFVIDNSKMSVEEQNQEVLSTLIRWGWIEST